MSYDYISEPPISRSPERWTEIEHAYQRALGEAALITRYGYNEAMRRIEAVEQMNRESRHGKENRG
jgi:hypothetical protein